MSAATGKHFQAVLFDLDGTLADTAPDFLAVLARQCRDEGIEPPSREAVLSTVSAGARALVTLAFGTGEEVEGFAERHRCLLALYGEQLQRSEARLYPDMAGLLTWLKQRGIAWGVVTNKPLAYAGVLMRQLGLAEQCDVLICPDHVSETKPHPEPLLLACRKLGCGPDTAIYVGDHPRDIEAGQRAGMHTAAAAWGYLPTSPPIGDWGAEHIVTGVAGLNRILEGAPIGQAAIKE